MTEYETTIASLRTLGATLTPAQVDSLKEAHEQLGFACNAHAEGQSCCVDFILDGADVR